MKLALSGAFVYIADIRPDELKKLNGAAHWDAGRRLYRITADAGGLAALASVCKLPEKLKSLRERFAACSNAQMTSGIAVPERWPVRAKLYAHQQDAATRAVQLFAQRNGGFGLLFEMGCGKTLTAIAIMGSLYLAGALRRALIVAPSSVCAVWPKEFLEKADFPAYVRVLEGSQSQRVKTIDESANKRIRGVCVMCINYESVWRTEIINRLQQWQPDMVVADESQRIKSPQAKQSRAMHKLSDQAKYRLILSGTPVQNNAQDLWSQYRFLDKEVFGTNFYTFRSRYAIMGGYEGRQIVGYKNMDELIKKEFSIASRVTKQQALDLPEQTFENRYVRLSVGEREIYNQIKRAGAAEIEGAAKVEAANVLSKLLRLQQIAGGFLKADGEDRPRQIGHGKLDAIADILEDYVIDGGHKLVIFARFLPELDAVERLTRSKKIEYVRLDGSVDMRLRGEIVRRFQEDMPVKVFLGQLDTVGLGITLTAADTAVYYSLNFNFASYSQSLSRIHRIGQTNKCTYIHLLAENTVDEKILSALAGKEDLAKRIVDSWRDYF